MAGRIIGLMAENVKRIKVVAIKPNGQPVVVVGGRNGQGKTSTLDAVEMALRGGKSIPQQPVREGELEASIILETDELIVHRTIQQDRSSTLVVTNKQGAKFAKPQDLLDKLVGSLSFDPLAFTRMKPKEQEETLRELLGIDTERLDVDRQIAFEERTVINRDVKQLTAQVNGMPWHDDAPEEELSAAEIQASLAEAKAHNANVAALDKAVTDADAALDALAKRWTEADDTIARLMSELKAAQASKIGIGKSIKEAEQERQRAFEASQAVQPIDENEIVQKLVDVSDVNRRISENAERIKRMKELESKEAEAAALTAQIQAIDAKKKQMLSDAEYPIPGLSIHPEGGVYLNDIPLSQASGAESLRASMAIAFAMNPNFPVALIRDGSLLDSDSLADVERMAAERGCQVWMERVGEGDECSVIISEGEVKTSRLHAVEALAAK